MLIITYIIHNVCAGLFPDHNIPINFLIQNSLAYAGGILVAFYFFYYITTEFQINPLGSFGIKSFLLIVVSAFILLFMLPYHFYGSLALSKKLFLGVPLTVAAIVLHKIGKALFTLYKHRGHKKSKLYKYKVIAGYVGLLTISLMPVVNATGDYQSVQQSIVNFGFFLMMIVYIVELISQAQREAIVLSQIEFSANATTTYEMQIAAKLTKDVLEKLQRFEDNREYLQGKVTLNILAKRFDTNPRYLSQIVNSNKGKPFKQYISDLKIEYIKYRLGVDKKYRNYTLMAIAHELGYTPDALAKAFYKKEQIKLSKYIKKIRDN
jgi:AraC-like DNA-binding protein